MKEISRSVSTGMKAKETLDLVKKVGVGLGEITIKPKFIREVYLRKVGGGSSVEGQLKQMEQDAKDKTVKEGIGKVLPYIQQWVTNP